MVDVQRARRIELARMRAKAKAKGEARFGTPAVGYTPAERTPVKHRDVAGVTRALEKGKGQPWADLVDQMDRTDGHLHGVRDNVLVAISGADLRVDPGHAAPGEEQLAADAADFVLRDLQRVTYLPRLIDHLAFASLLGWSVAAHRWRRVPDRGSPTGWVWHSDPEIVAGRDVDFVEALTLRIRVYDERGRQHGWVDVPTRREADQERGEVPADRLMILFGSRSGAQPHMSGDLLACRWPWYFKLRLEVLRQKGYARFSTPVPYSIFGPNAGPAVREDTLEGLTAMDEGRPFAFERGVEVHAWGAEGAESGIGNFGTSIGEAVEYLDREQTKALMGSTDNVEAEGGSYARAQNQAGVTIYPRFWTIGDEVGRCMAHQWARHTLAYNRHVFGGVMPPVPKVWFQLTAEERQPIPAEAIMGGLIVSQNELRASYDLDPLSAESGGNARVRPQAKARMPQGDVAREGEAEAVEEVEPDITASEGVHVDRRKRAYRLRAAKRGS